MKNQPTLLKVFAEARLRPSHQTAISFKVGNNWLSGSYSELFSWAQAIGTGLFKLGARPGSRIAILSDTRREWWIADLAIMGIHSVTVPIYQSQRPEEVKHILNDSETSLLILEDRNQLQKWQSISKDCPSVKSVIVIEQDKDLTPETLTWEKLFEIGQEAVQEFPDYYLQQISKQSSQDLATIIYTSGTTGEPKGVELTHRQIMGEIESVLSVIPLSERDTSLAFLPFAHVLGRMESWVAVAAGFHLAFAESVDRLRFNLEEIKPTLLIAVPRIFEKFYAAIHSQAESNAAFAKIFNWALDIGKQMSHCRQLKQTPSVWLSSQYALADRLVLERLRKKLGGRLRFAVSGGAPLAKEIAEFFHAVGVLILEGYGLTETTAAVTANSPLSYKFGTVGRALPGVEIQIAADGEILVRGPQVMRGYYHQKPMEFDSYFSTGDIGEIDAEGFLRITDRKKDLIKTAGGKYVAPQKLENLLKMNPYISQALIHGDQEKYIVAILTLNEIELTRFAKSNDISYQDFAMLCQHPQVKGLVRGIVASVNSQLASYETIKNFAIFNRDFTVADGELTPSLKIKRKLLSEKYRDLVQSLYD